MKKPVRAAAGRRLPRRAFSPAEAARRKMPFLAAEDFYRQAVESLREYALITTNKALKITTWSGPAAAMFGYRESEIVGRDVARLFTPEDIKAGIHRREFRIALKNGREDDERWHVRKDGRRLWCYGLSFPLRDRSGVVRGFIKLIRDDSQRKAKDDKLRESEERLRLAAESTGLGTWDFDAVQRVLLLSPRAAGLFGLSPEHAAAGFDRLVENVVPQDRERVRAAFERCLGAATPHDADVDHRTKTPGGGVRWVRTLIRGFHDLGGAEGAPPTRLLGTVVDVTVQKESEKRAREAKADLERRVRQRTQDLTALNAELETFAYSAAHDLRAPLRKISAYSDAILRSQDSRLGADDQAHFDRIRAATTKMLGLIDGTLALAHASRKPLQKRRCDLSAAAREIAGQLRRSDPGRPVDFMLADGLCAHGDPELLSLALRQLLENAWKFTSRHPRARIEFGARRLRGRPVYFVSDDGAGFEMAHAGKLFGAFRRLHGEGDFPGAGVGLGIVERVVRRHGGRVWAEAEPERGATFFFTLQGAAE